MKVYVRAPMSEIRLQELKELFDEVVYDPWNKTGERFYEKEMLEALNNVQPDILITELDRITEEVLFGYDGLKAIGDCRANPANIDVAACSAHGIPVLCTPARNATAVAEMLVGMLITYMRNILPAAAWIKDGQWKEGTTPYYTWMGNELHGKHVGFVGFGAVGKAAAHLLDAFGCKISFYDPYVKAGPYNKCELKALFAECDIISIHLPVLPSTEKLISRELLYTMKESAIFVNTARSAVVDMEALKDMAKENRIKGILLDVLESEPPLPQDLEIIDNDCVLLIPHICGATYEVTNHQSDIITERLKAWLKQEQLESVVYNYRSLKEAL